MLSRGDFVRHGLSHQQIRQTRQSFKRKTTGDERAELVYEFRESCRPAKLTLQDDEAGNPDLETVFDVDVVELRIRVSDGTSFFSMAAGTNTEAELEGI